MSKFIFIFVILISFSQELFSNDSLTIKLRNRIVNYRLGKYTIELEIKSPDSSLYTTKAKFIAHLNEYDSIACKYPNSIFINFSKDDSRIFSSTIEVFESYRDTRRFRKKLAKGRLRVSTAGYGFEKGMYSLYLIYFSKKYNTCFKSNKVNFIVEE